MPRLIPELFPQTPLHLDPNESFYAYFDSYEEIEDGGEENLVIQFNCIRKNYADRIEITSNVINETHSIIIELTGPKQEIRNLFPNRRISALESKWMLLKMSNSPSSFMLNVYVNFELYTEFPNDSIPRLESLTLFENLTTQEKNKIKELIRATTIEESPPESVSSFLNDFEEGQASHVMVYNVGQGNFNAIVNSRNRPLLFFDVGGGCLANKKTYPNGFKVCDCATVPVVLSHWDMDHIISAFLHPRLLESKWLVPGQQNLSIDAIRLANALKSKSNLTVWNNRISILGNSIRLFRCSGNVRNKNNSGLALLFKGSEEKCILFPGDASFNNIPGLQGFLISGLVASHHGSKVGHKQIPDCKTYGMVAYSYGKENTYNHPNPDTIKEYTGKNWIYSLYTHNGNIALSETISHTHYNCMGKQGNSNLRCMMQIDQYF